MKIATILPLAFLWLGVEAHYPTEYPHVSFMGQTLANHSYVDLSQVGTNSGNPGNTVRCRTDLCTCCTTNQGSDRGDWFFPNGESLSTSYYYYGMRHRDQRVDVYQRHRTMPSGIYHCGIETRAVHGNSTTARESVFVGVYLSNEGIECVVVPSVANHYKNTQET